MEILVIVVAAFALLGVAAQRWGADTRFAGTTGH
jgi:hypothetical protein